MMSVEHWWNDTDRAKQKYWEKNMSHYDFVHHISQDGLASDGTRYSRRELT
jgi:hypothetical protein